MTTYQTDAMTMKRAAATIRMVMAVKMTRTVPMSRNLCYAMFEYLSTHHQAMTVVVSSNVCERRVSAQPLAQLS